MIADDDQQDLIRLGRFLRTYGWSATAGEFLDVVVARVRAHADGILRTHEEAVQWLRERRTPTPP